MIRLFRHFPFTIRECPSCKGEGKVLELPRTNLHMLALGAFALSGFGTAWVLGHGIGMMEAVFNISVALFVGYILLTTFVIHTYHKKGYNKGEI